MVEQSYFQQILDSLLTAVLVLDEKSSISYMNASAEMLLGVSGEQMQGKPIDECFSENDGTPVSLREALRENKNFTKRKARWILHNQQVITVDYSAIPSPETGTIVIEVQPLDRLIRISREEALISSQETSRNLVKSMAHEIKNPLGGIRGAAQLLARELENEEELGEYTSIIINETDRLRNLVDRMLGPRTPAMRKPINIHEVLERVLAVIRAEVGNQIKLVRDYDPSIPEVQADQEQLIQATLNIARNAMQSLLEYEAEMKDGKRITFSTRVQRRYTIGRTHYPLVARIGIHDNGPGIPPEIAEDIFFPMITGRAEGSGIGLAISQNIIGQHNGLIECESEKGSTEFVIYLPLGNNYE